jgi:DNA-directed RNA polymerase sigma subunit (sigma70/sigma32)
MFSNQDAEKVLSRMLDTLTHKEASLLRERIGLSDEKTQVLEEFRLSLNLSHDRVKALENKAFRQLNHRYCS